MIGYRGCGAIPDKLLDAEIDGRARHVGALIGARPGYAPARDWSHLLDFVPDQGGTNRCVGWSFSTAMFLAGQAKGDPIPRPSPKWLYDIARYYDTPGVLVDVGSRPRSMALAASMHGVVAESRLESNDRNVNEAPPFDADLAGADALFTGYYKVDGNVPTLLRMALDKGHFPTFAMVVHESFQNLGRDAVYDEPDGTELGRHMVTLVGYNQGAFRLLNSWGTAWADRGFCWVTDRFVASHYVSDRYVVTAAPPVR